MEQKLVNDIIDLKSILLDGLLDKGIDVLIDKGTDYGIRTGTRHGIALAGVAGGPLVAVTEGIAALLTIVDTVYTAATIPLEIYNALDALEKELERLQKLKVTYSENMTKLSRQLELQKKIKDKIELNPNEKNELKKLKEDHNKEFKDLATKMGKKASASPCIKAKRCQLVSYSDSSKNSNKMNKTAGCCPGQTGHHLLPQAYFKDTCPGYNKEKAPCICVEGTNQGDGTHGKMHDEHDKEAGRLVTDGKLSYSDAKKAAFHAANETFKKSCKPRCLEQQLDDYHKIVCGNTPVINPVNKRGGFTG